MSKQPLLLVPILNLIAECEPSSGASSATIVKQVQSSLRPLGKLEINKQNICAHVRNSLHYAADNGLLEIAPERYALNPEGSLLLHSHSNIMAQPVNIRKYAKQVKAGRRRSSTSYWSSSQDSSSDDDFSFDDKSDDKKRQ